MFDQEDKDRQQIGLWVRKAEESLMARHFIAAIHLYEKALADSRRVSASSLRARICRDLAYLYLHHGATEKAKGLIEEGLQQEADDPVVRLGLLSNAASVHIREKNYAEGLRALNRAVETFDRAYSGAEAAPFAVATSFAALYRLRRTLNRIVDLMASGINPERIQVDFQPAPPFWDGKS